MDFENALPIPNKMQNLKKCTIVMNSLPAKKQNGDFNSFNSLKESELVITILWFYHRQCQEKTFKLIVFGSIELYTSGRLS